MSEDIDALKTEIRALQSTIKMQANEIALLRRANSVLRSEHNQMKQDAKVFERVAMRKIFENAQAKEHG